MGNTIMLLGFDESLHRQHLIANIRKQCVEVPRVKNSSISEIVDWCEANIGERRPYHPIYEAEQDGWIDYFDGEWAYSFYVDDEVHLFWIMNRDKRTEFKMRWL